MRGSDKVIVLHQNYMAVKQKSYYPCDICGENTPNNKVTRNENGQFKSRCPMHEWRDVDKIKSQKIAKRKERTLNDLRKGIATEDV